MADKTAIVRPRLTGQRLDGGLGSWGMGEMVRDVSREVDGLCVMCDW